MLNVNGSDDPAYRYKMPALVTKPEGRGNGVKTIIINMRDVAKSLMIHPTYTSKYLGATFGALSGYDEGTGQTQVNGRISQSDMQEALQKFINRFILCPGCKQPELTMTAGDAKGELHPVHYECRACGCNGELKDSKNEKKTNSQIIKVIRKNPMFDTHARDAMRGAEAGAEDEEVSTIDPVTRVREVLDQGQSVIIDELRAMRRMSAVMKRDRLPLCVSAVFTADLLEPKYTRLDEDGDEVECSLLELNAPLLEALTDSKEMQFVLLRSFELFMYKHKERMLTDPQAVCGVLSTLHEEGIIDEDTFLEWADEHSQMTTRVVHDAIIANAGPFLDFLREESDEESESEEESEEEASEEEEW